MSIYPPRPELHFLCVFTERVTFIPIFFWTPQNITSTTIRRLFELMFENSSIMNPTKLQQFFVNGNAKKLNIKKTSTLTSHWINRNSREVTALREPSKYPHQWWSNFFHYVMSAAIFTFDSQATIHLNCKKVMTTWLDRAVFFASNRFGTSVKCGRVNKKRVRRLFWKPEKKRRKRNTEESSSGTGRKIQVIKPSSFE